MSFFKKAMGLFVEFDDTSTSTSATPSPAAPATSTDAPMSSNSSSSRSNLALNQEELDKFEKHFDKLFDSANLPGPDYYEFWKTMDTLEQHIPDEKARFSATFASLSIQGMTKDKLVQTATHYRELIQKDKQAFDKAFMAKSGSEITGRQNAVKELDQKIAANSALIQKLTREISESQTKIMGLKKEMIDEESKLSNSRNGYDVACNAMLVKINTDIEKINSIL
jgi:chromosome segregation ATPase